ncbi:MAG: hypothetical protein ACI91B_002853 [Planctomycetota bacterium]|jgi:hypothetical protein
MVFAKVSDRKTLTRFPDKAELAEDLELPNVHTIHLRLSQKGHRTIARWKIPWIPVIFTFATAFGAVTAGVLYGYSIDRLGSTGAAVLLGIVWLLFLPLVLWVAFRASRRAMTRRTHLVLDLDTRQLTVACLDRDDEVIGFDQVMALVQIRRMIESGHGGGRWDRVDEFSIVSEVNDGSHLQLPLYSIQDSGKREEQLRRWTNELPRVLGCERVRITLDRKGQLQD